MEDSKLKPLCHLFFNLARNEKKVEIIKEMLCQWEDFEPYTAFKRLVRSNSLISAEILQNFLSESKLFHEEETIKSTFISHYDLDGDGFLSYSEYT